MARSAPTCTTACRSTRCRYRRCASAGRRAAAGGALSRTQPHAAGHSQPAPVGQRTGRPAPLPLAGNIRELEHVISRAALKALSHGADHNAIVTLEAPLLDLDALGPSAPAPLAPSTPAALQPPTAEPATLPSTLRAAVDACQRQCIQAALARHGGNWAGAARELDIDASNLHKLARRLALKD